MPRDGSKPILEVFASATVPASKGWETGLERFRLLPKVPDACSKAGAERLGFSFVLSASLRGIGQTPKGESIGHDLS